MELHQQICFYNCFASNNPIPSALLISLGKLPIPRRKSSASSAATAKPAYFQMGYVKYADLEPNRCHRTDGKKWRCSKDAVTNRKYCERHINRGGRLRSRKHVEEGESSHDAKVIPSSVPLPSSSVVPSAALSNDVPIVEKPTVNLQPSPTVSTFMQLSWMSATKESGDDSPSDSRDLSMQSSELKALSASLSISTGSTVSTGTFETIFDNSFLNLQSYSFTGKDSTSSLELDNQKQNFISELSQPQLSVQLPLASPEFSSCSSSSSLALSPLMLFDEYAPFDEQFQNAMNWEPVPWAVSMGGPLGEIFAINGDASAVECKSCPSSSNLVATEEWDLSPEFWASLTSAAGCSNQSIDLPRID